MGYKGDINKNCLTIAEMLKPAGYTSYASGKWHLSANIKPKGDRSNWPMQCGFDGYFGILQGSASYYTPKSLTSGNKALTATPDFYLTDAIADSATTFINNQANSKKPFFFVRRLYGTTLAVACKRSRYSKIYEDLREGLG